jgi:hypothetical protein
MNEPSEWRNLTEPEQTHMHAAFPRDGRETLHRAYEYAQPTMTVGQYLRAAQRVRAHDPALPSDYADYLAQRVPSARHFEELPPNMPIDRFGKVG